MISGFDNKEQKIRKIYIYLAFNVYLLIKPLSSNFFSYFSVVYTSNPNISNFALNLSVKISYQFLANVLNCFAS